jgi:hypothetical protein
VNDKRDVHHGAARDAGCARNRLDIAKAMVTSVMSSSTVTLPVPSQSPTRLGREGIGLIRTNRALRVAGAGAHEAALVEIVHGGAAQ